MHDYESPPLWLRVSSRSGRAKQRKEIEKRIQEWPGPRSTTLWRQDSRQAGLVVRQYIPWHSGLADGKTLEPFDEAVRLARQHFDAVVLMERTSWPSTHVADHFVVLADAQDYREDIPVSESVPFSYDRQPGRPQYPLTPEQSAAVIRDRYLRFLGHSPVSLLGLITVFTRCSQNPAPGPGADFLKGVEENMRAVGCPLLGRIILPSFAARIGRSSDPADILSSPADTGVTSAARALRAAG